LISLTALVQVFGSVARVNAQAIAGATTRVIAEGPRAGHTFAVDVPTHVAALYEFDNGGVANVVLSFDSPISRVALEDTGTQGALRLPDPNQFTGDSDLFAPNGTQHVVTASGPGGPARGTGVVDLVRSLHASVPERASAVLAQHVLDVMLATEEASRTKQSVLVSSRVEPAPLLPDAWAVTDPSEGP
jgi:predicted dehydrogenase